MGASPLTQSTSGDTSSTTTAAAAAQLPSGGSSVCSGGTGGSPSEFYLHPAVVRRADSSAASVNEWTGERMSRDADVSEDVKPASVAPLGNYAVRLPALFLQEVCVRARARTRTRVRVRDGGGGWGG